MPYPDSWGATDRGDRQHSLDHDRREVSIFPPFLVKLTSGIGRERSHLWHRERRNYSGNIGGFLSSCKKFGVHSKQNHIAHPTLNAAGVHKFRALGLTDAYFLLSAKKVMYRL